MEIITKAAAKAAGLTTYFTGAACKHGHVAPRKVANNNCIPCAREGQRRLFSKQAKDPEFVRNNRARAAQWAKDNPEKARERLQRWRAKNPGRDRAIGKRARDKDPARYREVKKTWQKRNPERHKSIRAAAFHRRRVRQQESAGNFTAEDVEYLRRKQKDKCAECRKRRRLTVDHIVPLYHGGSNHHSNLQLLCRPCNSRKGAKDPLAWAQENGRLV